MATSSERFLEWKHHVIDVNRIIILLLLIATKLENGWRQHRIEGRKCQDGGGGWRNVSQDIAERLVKQTSDYASLHGWGEAQFQVTLQTMETAIQRCPDRKTKAALKASLEMSI